jgi:indole-3-glycerol phosphate synthase
MNALDPILEATRAEVERRRTRLPVEGLPAREGPVRPFTQALADGPDISLIAEHKRRSPSAGTIREGASIEDVVCAYERGGARALSVLTDGPSFGGSLDDLRAARAASALPVLRKDFIVDRYQLHESFAAGADAILLIVAALGPEQLAELHEEARSLGLAALVEVHDEDELLTAATVGPDLIGINNRDLTTLGVDVERTYQLLPGVPAGATVVSESGLRDREQLERLSAAGVDAVLIGESLMRAPDPEAACSRLTGRIYD